MQTDYNLLQVIETVKAVTDVAAWDIADITTWDIADLAIKTYYRQAESPWERVGDNSQWEILRN